MYILAPKFLDALKTIGDVDEEAISEAHLRTEYGKLQEQVFKVLIINNYSMLQKLITQVSESVERQTDLEKRIEVTYAQFQRETQQHGTSARDNTLKELATGFDVYQEIMNNLQEGSQFYNNLTPLLVKLQSKVSDFVFARTTEKDDLLKYMSLYLCVYIIMIYHFRELQRTIVQAPTTQPPANPQYQQAQGHIIHL